jgi:two-component system invasion response regulator UvrY
MLSRRYTKVTMRVESNSAALRILVVDDHEIMREGLLRILADADEQWHTTASGNGHEALDVLNRQQIDLAIVDLAMPGMGGLDLIKRIRADHSDVAIMVLTMYAQEQYALRAFRAGAKGYVTKDVAGVELVTAVRKVAAGGAYVTPSLAESVVLQLHGSAAAPRHDKLSDREMEVLRKLVAGDRLTDIGEALHLSVKTVSTHKSRILEKLGLPNLAALVRYGLEHGMLVDAERETSAPRQGA